MYWQLRHGTSNRKLGASCWVVTFSRDTCPDSCPLRGAGCYAEAGPLRLHWDRVSRGAAKADKWTRWAGEGLMTLCRALEIAPFRYGDTLRLGDAGDPIGSELHQRFVKTLRDLKGRGVRIILYSHADFKAPILARAASALAAEGIALNESRHGTEGLPSPLERPSVTTVARDVWATGSEIRRLSDDERPVSIRRCPAEYADTACTRCGWCADATRRFVVGFTAHGTQKRKVEALSSAHVPT